MTLAVERVESDSGIVGFDQWPFDVRIVHVPDTTRIIVRLWFRRIEKAHNGTTIRADIVVYDPALVIVTLAFVVRLMIPKERPGIIPTVLDIELFFEKVLNLL